MSVILTHEEDNLDSENGEDFGDGLVAPEAPIHTEVSLNFVMGISSPKTLKLKGSIDGAPVVVMVDPGATHNFVFTELVTRLNLQITPTKPFEVSLGTGQTVRGEGEC